MGETVFGLCAVNDIYGSSMLTLADRVGLLWQAVTTGMGVRTKKKGNSREPDLNSTNLS